MRNTVYLVCNETRYDTPDFSTRVIYIDNQKRIWLFFNIIGTKLDSWQKHFNNWSVFNGSTYKNKKTSTFSKEMWKNFQRSCVLFFPIPDFFIDCIQVSGLGFTNKHYIMRRSIIVPTVTLSYIRTYRLTATSRQRPLHFVPEDSPYILILFQLYHCSKHKLSTILIANVTKLACVAWK